MPEESQRIAHLWFEVMWSRPDLSVADEIVDPSYAPAWIHIDTQVPAPVKSVQCGVALPQGKQLNWRAQPFFMSNMEESIGFSRICR